MNGDVTVSEVIAVTGNGISWRIMAFHLQTNINKQDKVIFVPYRGESWLAGWLAGNIAK